ncbi:MAG: response regulator transcription factor [Acidobacteriota bacterium]|nr:response regulator transcription factor [Acidobacteriota bacterium]MDW3228359.1 response regulator transcription factor [Acidobacteriota bacterium]MDY0232334.1 response regulator transcription factor [Candidatus Saccharicenans sp.]
MAKIIAVLDDEEDILELLRTYLTRAGFKVETFVRPEAFLKYIDLHQPDLILLDLMLPGADGLEICRYLKGKPEKSIIPVIMLTARSQEADRVTGLELGADDYVTKPFSLRELEARIKAVLRREDRLPGAENKEKKLAGGKLIINPEKHEVRIKGQPLELSLSEFRILELLSSRPGRVFTRDQILDYLWGGEKVVVTRTVDVHIHHLREKMGELANLIQSVRAVGYRYQESDK